LLPAVNPSLGVAAVVRGDEAYALERNVELLRGNLDDRGLDALPQLRLAGEHRHAVGGVDADPCVEVWRFFEAAQGG
jgi:hypothetical protein